MNIDCFVKAIKDQISNYSASVFGEDATTKALHHVAGCFGLSSEVSFDFMVAVEERVEELQNEGVPTDPVAHHVYVDMIGISMG